MCDICSGTTFDEYFEQAEERIGEEGFTLVAVEADPPWIYTIGLVERFDHPELLLADGPVDFAPDAMGELARRVVEGGRIEPGVDVFVDGVRFHVDAVGDARWADDTFAGWYHYYDWRPGTGPPSPSAVELVLCGRHTLGPAPEPPRRPHEAAGRAPRGPNRVRRRQLRRRRHRSGHPQHGGP